MCDFKDAVCPCKSDMLQEAWASCARLCTLPSVGEEAQVICLPQKDADFQAGTLSVAGGCSKVSEGESSGRVFWSQLQEYGVMGKGRELRSFRNRNEREGDSCQEEISSTLLLIKSPLLVRGPAPVGMCRSAFSCSMGPRSTLAVMLCLFLPA